MSEKEEQIMYGLETFPENLPAFFRWLDESDSDAATNALKYILQEIVNRGALRTAAETYAREQAGMGDGT